MSFCWRWFPKGLSVGGKLGKKNFPREEILRKIYLPRVVYNTHASVTRAKKNTTPRTQLPTSSVFGTRFSVNGLIRAPLPSWILRTVGTLFCKCIRRAFHSSNAKSCAVVRGRSWWGSVLWLFAPLHIIDMLFARHFDEAQGGWAPKDFDQYIGSAPFGDLCFSVKSEILHVDEEVSSKSGLIRAPLPSR